MYQTGTRFNFEVRVHQLPTGIADINQYKVESGNYASMPRGDINKWQKEITKKTATFTYPR